MTRPNDKQKAKRDVEEFSLLDIIMPRKAITRYGTAASPEEVIQSLKTLDNHTSRNVVIAKKPTPNGIRYNFRIEYREFRETDDALRFRGEKKAKAWETVKHIDGTIMAGTEYPTLIEFTPERLTTSLWAMAGGLFFVFFVLSIDLPSTTKTPLLIGTVIIAALIFLTPYIYVTYGSQKTMLEQRMQDILDKVGAERIEGSEAPKPKRRTQPKAKSDV